MGNLLKDGAIWLEEQRHAHMTSEVIYIRGANRIAVLVTIGRTPYELVDDQGVAHQHELRDYILRAADLLTGGDTFEPAAGDHIEETIADAVVVFEVVALAGEPCWRFADPNQASVRVHTQRVKP